MGPSSYMQSVVDRYVVVRCIPIVPNNPSASHCVTNINVEHLLIPHLPNWKTFHYRLSATAHSTQAGLHPLKKNGEYAPFPDDTLLI